jgi:dynein heavy chain
MATQTDREINKQIAQMKEDLKREPANLTNYVEFVNKLQASKKLFEELSDKKKKLEEMKAVLGKYRVKDENSFANQTKISNLQAKIDVLTDLLAETEEDIKKADERAKSGKESNMESLVEVITEEQKKIADYISKIESETLMSKATPNKDALTELKRLEQKFETTMSKISEFRDYEKTLNAEPVPIKEIDEFQVKYARRFKIWNNLSNFQDLKKKWYYENWKEQNSEEILKIVGQYAKQNMEMKMKMAKEDVDEVLDELIAEVKSVDEHKVLISALGSRAMMERHWKKVYDKLDAQMPPNLDLSIYLQELIEQHHAMDHVDAIEDISGAAQGEMQIQQTMEGVVARWEEINFTVVGYRDQKERYIIADIEDLITALEDDTMTVSTMMGSKFVVEIKTEVETMERKLIYLSELIDEWLKFQKQWMYLENIFNAEDIIKQLPNEAKSF